MTMSHTGRVLGIWIRGQRVRAPTASVLTYLVAKRYSFPAICSLKITIVFMINQFCFIDENFFSSKSDELALILPLEFGRALVEHKLSQKMFVQKVHFLTFLEPGLGEILQTEH